MTCNICGLFKNYKWLRTYEGLLFCMKLFLTLNLSHFQLFKFGQTIKQKSKASEHRYFFVNASIMMPMF